jgi:PII-like signaling protein
MFIDENEKIKNVLPHIKELIKEGIIIKENVELA